MSDPDSTKSLPQPNGSGAIKALSSRYRLMDPDLYEYGRDTFMKAVRDGDRAEVERIIKETDKFNPFFVCDLDDALSEAAAHGKQDILRLLLEEGATVDSFKLCDNWNDSDKPCECTDDLNHYNGCQGTALMEASRTGNYQMVSLLLCDYGADVNVEPIPHVGGTPLQQASGGGYMQLVDMLLRAGADVNARPARSDGRTALQAAAEGGHVETVARLLEADADINAEPASSGGRTALQAAAAGGHAEIVASLLKAGAEVNAGPAASGGRTALQAAAEGGHAELVARLLKARADVNAGPAVSDGRTALQAAAAGGHAEIVVSLLAAGADVNATPAVSDGRTALQAAAADHLDIVVNIVETGASNGRTALQAAAEGGHAEIVASLLEAGADINARPAISGGRTALQAAAEGGHVEVLASLLAAGAEVNAEPADSDGGTALQVAAAGGNAELVTRLLKAGADINAEPASSGGRTALQAAAAGGHAEIVASLLKAGADINAEPAISGGRTALQAAAAGGHAEIVASLLKAGAEVNAEPAYYDGRTALQAAAEGGHVEVLKSLLEAAEGGNVFTGLGRTAPPQVAVAGGNIPPQADALVKAHPSPNARDISSIHTRYVYCLQWGIARHKVVQLMLAYVDNSVMDRNGWELLRIAMQGRNIKSVALLLLYGPDPNTRDQDNQTPLDLLRDVDERFKLQFLQILLWSGCKIRGRRIKLWHEIFDPSSRNLSSPKSSSPKPWLTIYAPPVPYSCMIRRNEREDPASNVDQRHPGKLTKTSIRFELSPKLTPTPLTGRYGWRDRRRLHHSTEDIETVHKAISQMFREIDPKTDDLVSSGTMRGTTGSPAHCSKRWKWDRKKVQLEKAIALSNVGESGHGLPTNLISGAVDGYEVFLTCYVSFGFSLQAFQRQSKVVQDNAFQVALPRSTAVWIMRKPRIVRDQDPAPRLRTIDFVSTLDIGWVPDDAVDLFRSFMIDLQKKWRDLIEKADIHLDQNRETLLYQKGRSAWFVEVLLHDAQTWSRVRSLLETHVRTARDILKDFRETKYLQEEIGDAKRALEGLSETIKKMEKEMLEEIKDLDNKTQRMIELEFNLAQIYESRTSREMGMSMKRLSWITFVFLPLMFVVSMFGMNVDIVSGGPKWTWALVLALCLFAVVMLVWGLLKCFPVDQWIQEHQQQVQSARPRGKDNSKRHGWGFWRNEACKQDLESGELSEFSRPEKIWARKLKDH